MITFDSEDDSRGRCFLMGFYNGVEYTSFELKDYKTENEFRASIINYIISSNENLFIAHNLEYDLSHIFQQQYLTILDWYYSSNLIFSKIPHTNIKFIDSFHFSYTSLKNLGKEIKHGKKEIDIDNIYEEYLKNPDLVLEYNESDCIIVYKYMKKFINTIKKEFDVNIKNTLSGTSQSIFIKKFCKYDLVGHNNNEALLNYYYGGRTECFHIGEVNRPIFEIDVNSMYPYVMRNNVYPISDYVLSKEPISKLYVSHIRVKIKKDTYLPILPYRTDKLLFPVGEFETFASSVEIEKAIQEKQIKDIEYYESYNFFDTAKVFSEFIDFFYTKRKQAKDEDNKFDSELYKRIMNHLYGRFALHKDLKVLTAITDKNKDYINPVTLSAGYVTIPPNDKSKNYSLSLFVTAYARIYLYDLLKKVSKKYSILYCDTDSCYFTNFKYIPLMDMIADITSDFNIDNVLGNYSLNAYESGIFYNVKAYILNKYSDEKKIKLKGVAKDHREEFLINGNTEYRKPIRLRSSLKSKKDIKVNSWELHPMTRRGSYAKRDLIKISESLFNTKPLEMLYDKNIISYD